MKKPLTPKTAQMIFIGITALIIIVASLAWHSSGQSSKIQVEALQTTMTPSAPTLATPLPPVKHEPDVTFGIVLAGILLVVVILFGTLHGTRRFQKPPRVP